MQRCDILIGTCVGSQSRMKPSLANCQQGEQDMSLMTLLMVIDDDVDDVTWFAAWGEAGCKEVGRANPTVLS